MPRVTHVKRAQQRYATRPVLDPATGQQKVVPVMRKDGQQKTTKSGRPVFLKITERDLERPLPMPQCDAPNCPEATREIAVGTAYKWIEPSGQRVRNRHATCPTWQVWEYSSSLSARISQLQADGPTDFETEDDAQEWANSKAEEIRGLAEEKRESAQNIEDGFGHSTYQSEELTEIADQLDEWADNLESVDLPDFPEAEDVACDACDGTGEVEAETEGEDDDDTTTCEECSGAGTVDSDEVSEDALAAWQDEVRSALEDVLGEAPC